MGWEKKGVSLYYCIMLVSSRLHSFYLQRLKLDTSDHKIEHSQSKSDFGLTMKRQQKLGTILKSPINVYHLGFWISCWIKSNYFT